MAFCKDHAVGDTAREGERARHGGGLDSWERAEIAEPSGR